MFVVLALGGAGIAGAGTDRLPSRLKHSTYGLPSIPYPGERRPDSNLIRLGKKLFFDPRLSRDGQLACATCHVPSQGFTENGRAVRGSIDGRDLRLTRNAPTLLNVAFAGPLHHDGSEPSLERQVLAPLFAPAEMANTSIPELVARINGYSDYRELFEATFKHAATMDDLASALAAFERTLTSGSSRFDRWRYRGEWRVVDRSVRRGFELFRDKAGCAACHTVGDKTALFTDNQFHNTGIGFMSESRRTVAGGTGVMDRGREEVTHEPADRFKFRTPTLRNVALTAPYMHDGSLATLEDVVRHYDLGGGADPAKDQRLKPLGLSETERADLIAFLKNLTGGNAAHLMAMRP